MALRMGTISTALAFAVVLPASAQSLGDVARQEEARRATVKATRSFSNADLKPDPLSVPPLSDNSGEAVATQSGFLSASTGKYLTAEEMIRSSAERIAAADRAKSEQHWRERATTIRSEQLKARQDVELMSQTSTSEDRSPGERALAVKLLRQRQAMLDDLDRRRAKLEQDAARANVPKEWLEPKP